MKYFTKIVIPCELKKESNRKEKVIRAATARLLKNYRSFKPRSLHDPAITGKDGLVVSKFLQGRFRKEWKDIPLAKIIEKFQNKKNIHMTRAIRAATARKLKTYRSFKPRSFFTPAVTGKEGLDVSKFQQAKIKKEWKNMPLMEAIKEFQNTIHSQASRRRIAKEDLKYFLATGKKIRR